jgi:hypothetical protein
MERIREVKVTLYLDTNKRTIEKEFKSIVDLIDFARENDLGFLLYAKRENK